MQVLNNYLALEKRVFSTGLEVQNQVVALENTLVFVKANNTSYVLKNDGAYIVDGEKVLSSFMGGNARWVGVAGEHNYYSTTGGVSSGNIDGGRADSIYLLSQNINCGGA